MQTFLHILANTLLTSVTNMTVWFAITFFTYLQTQSVLATSILSGIYLVLTASTGIWFGSLVDHHKKKTMMLLASSISAVAFAAALIVYRLAPDAAFARFESVWLWSMIVWILLGVLVGNIRNIVLPTIVTMLIPEGERDKANGLSGTVMGVSFLITSVISGLLVGYSGMLIVLILGVVCNLLAILHLLAIKIHEEVHPHDDQPRKVDLSGTIALVRSVPGLLPLIIFSMWNNFLGGVFMSLMDAYGLSLVSVQIWGLLWGGVSTAFIVGGLVIARVGIGKKPVRSLFTANTFIWSICCIFTIYPSIIPLIVGMFFYLAVVPFIEAAEQTIMQKVVPLERQGRVFGFAQSVEQSASPLTAFAIGPITQFFVIPFMTTGAGASILGPFFGTGPARAMALVFTIAGVLGLSLTVIMWNSRFARALAMSYSSR